MLKKTIFAVVKVFVTPRNPRHSQFCTSRFTNTANHAYAVQIKT